LLEGEFSTPRKIAAGVPKDSTLAPILYNLYINDAPAAPGNYLVLFANDAYSYINGREKQELRFSTICNAASLQCSRGVKIKTSVGKS
jgi:hypothetical protein